MLITIMSGKNKTYLSMSRPKILLKKRFSKTFQTIKRAYSHWIVILTGWLKMYSKKIRMNTIRISLQWRHLTCVTLRIGSSILKAAISFTIMVRPTPVKLQVQSSNSSNFQKTAKVFTWLHCVFWHGKCNKNSKIAT